MNNIHRIRYKSANFSIPQLIGFKRMEIHAALAFEHESHPGGGNIKYAKKKGLSVIDITGFNAEISNPTNFTYQPLYTIYDHTE